MELARVIEADLTITGPKRWRWKLRERDAGGRIVASGSRRHATAEEARAELKAVAEGLVSRNPGEDDA
jgi:creatinine amidohydrolase/Fe(II)-dependent formamide hydrolase-like protein